MSKAPSRGGQTSCMADSTLGISWITNPGMKRTIDVHIAMAGLEGCRRYSWRLLQGVFPAGFLWARNS